MALAGCGGKSNGTPSGAGGTGGAGGTDAGAGGGDAAPTVYTIDLSAIDGGYVYAGLFTARQAQISFSNISLTVTN